MLKIDKTGVSTSKRVYFRMFLPSLASLSWRRARVFARSCSLLSKYVPISWKQRKEQSHAQCHVTHRIRKFDKISEHVKVAKSVDIAVPELAVTLNWYQLLSDRFQFHTFIESNTLISTPFNILREF